MAERGPSVPPAVCPRCYQVVTAKMPRVVTAGASYHHRCYVQVLHRQRDAVEAPVSLAHTDDHRPRAGGDRLPRLLERLAQIVFIVIVIGTGLILLEHVLP